MQYFNAIHCDRNISTSKLKNPFVVSPRIQQLLRICVRNPQHTSAAPAVAGLSLPWQCRVSLLTNEPCLFDSHAHV